jgi:hypothetical protein
MRAQGLPKLVTWRWAPCAALVLGSLSFVTFVTVAVPEQIGSAPQGHGAATLRLGPHLTHSLGEREPSYPPSVERHDETPSTPPVTRVAAHAAEQFPRRGFSPPLERPEPPPAPPPPPVLAPPPVPVLAPPPPAPSEPLQGAPAPAEAPQPPPETAAAENALAPTP